METIHSPEVVAEYLGTETSTLNTLGDYEVYFDEFDEGEIRVFLGGTLYPDQIAWIENEIISQGAVLTAPIVQDAGCLFIKFRKELAPLAIIGIAIAGVAVVGGGILGWQVFRVVKAGVPLWVILVAAGAVLYLVATSEPVKKAGRVTGRTAVATGKGYAASKGVIIPD